ncbi:MAG: Ig-like domain-containing protein, partial [Candidatus Thermoplasmatota archaeon]
GNGILYYNLTEICTWLSLNITSGSSSGEHDYIKLTINTTGLIAGNYSCNISINSNGGNATIRVNLTVIEQDNISPSIIDVVATPPLQDAGKNVTISCIVTDNVNVSDVFLNITYPNLTYENFSIFGNRTGNTFFCNRTYSMIGNYSFFIYAIDSSNNSAKSSSYNFEIKDLSAPEIKNVSYPSIGSFGIAINISCIVTDNVNVSDVFLNITYPNLAYENFSIFGNRTGNTFFCNRTYSMIGNYSFFIYAIDSSNNSNRSILQYFQIRDITPPSVEIIYPIGGEILGGNVTIRWNASDNYNGANVTITIKYSPNGGGLWINIATGEANDGSYIWNTAGLDDGSNYVIMVIATDSSHNSGSAISKNFTVDNTKPNVKIDKPEKGKMYIFDRGIIPIVGKPVIIGKITVEVTASDTYGMQKVEFYLDNSKKSEDFNSPYSWICDEKLVLTHKIKVIAYDKAGNKNEAEIEAIFFNPL